MNTLLIYMVKAAAYLMAFYFVYSVLLSRDTAYRRNRVFIIFSLIASLILPLFTFYTTKPLNIQFFGKFLSEVLVTATSTVTKPLNITSPTSDFLRLISSIYLAVMIVFILKFIINILNLFYLITRQKNEGSRIIKFHGFNTSGFSAVGHIFINTRLSTDESREIIRHEENHLKQNHFYDIIFIEVLTAFQWFNPVVYLFNRSLREIHEYQADESCLSSGISLSSYQKLLLSQVFESKAFNLTNSFSNPSLIKKRMIMMTKKRTTTLANTKLIIVVPVVSLVILTTSAVRSEIMAPPPAPLQNSSREMVQSQAGENDKEFAESETTPYVAVEEMPMFPGGDSELLRYIGANTVYPEKEKANNIQGRVIVRFCVTSRGSISLASVLKGVSPELDNEALRVVKTLPAFKPGKQGGKSVPVWYMVPITFTLK